MQKLKRGTIREDGMVFWAYAKNLKSGEHWITKNKYDEKLSKEKERLLQSLNSVPKEKRTLKRGTVREDGKVFIQYSKHCLNGEYWTDPKKLEKTKLREKNYSAKYRFRNPVKAKDSENRSRKKKLKNDPLYKLSWSVKGLIRKSFRKSCLNKRSRAEKILGCSIKFFKSYIENKFESGMTWENRSSWHLDHIIPIGLAKTEKEVVALNHYTNFQPLWAKINMAKGMSIRPVTDPEQIAILDKILKNLQSEF